MTVNRGAVRINDVGDLVMEGQSIGALPLEIFGKDDYEYFVTVSSGVKDALLLHLLRDRFLTDPTPTSTFMTYLKERDIPYHFDSW